MNARKARTALGVVRLVNGTIALVAPDRFLHVIGIDPERKKDFYLIVEHGRYVCGACSTPGPPIKQPHGTIEIRPFPPE